MSRHAIPFTQYIRPDGRKVQTDMPTDDDALWEKAAAIIDAGYVFEVEVLMNGMVSATINSPEHEQDVACALFNNTPESVSHVEKMIELFDIDKTTRLLAEGGDFILSEAEEAEAEKGAASQGINGAEHE